MNSFQLHMEHKLLRLAIGWTLKQTQNYIVIFSINFALGFQVLESGFNASNLFLYYTYSEHKKTFLYLYPWILSLFAVSFVI